LRTTEAQPCECGFDFETGDRSRAARRAEIVKHRATRQARIGFAVLFGALPLSALIAVKLGLGPIMFFVFITELVFGSGALARGLSWRRDAQRRLDRATKQAALPAARLLE
jgi:cytochrome b561